MNERECTPMPLLQESPGLSSIAFVLLGLNRATDMPGTPSEEWLNYENLRGGMNGKFLIRGVQTGIFAQLASQAEVASKLQILIPFAGFFRRPQSGYYTYAD